MNDRADNIRRIKAEAAMPKAPKVHVINKVSKKKEAQQKAEKELRGDNDTLKEQWFKARRKDMKGVCGCGCGEKSQKDDDMYFRCSAAHIFPKALFPSIEYHKLNWVERKFWATATTSACHTNMDEKSMELWPNFEDWDLIVERFHVLAPLLTDEERATKFYQQLEKLVYANNPSVIIAEADSEVNAIIIHNK